MPTTQQGRFIVLEGPDGCGKSTQAKLLAEALEARGTSVLATAEPTDGPAGRVASGFLAREVEMDAVTAALVFSADRADHLARTIEPALAAGTWVVCDRYLLSTIAYQGLGGADRGWICDVSSGFRVPDLTAVIDVGADALRDRLAQRGSADRFEDPARLRSVLDAYDESIAILSDLGHDIVRVPGVGPPRDTLETLLARLDELA